MSRASLPPDRPSTPKKKAPKLGGSAGAESDILQMRNYPENLPGCNAHSAKHVQPIPADLTPAGRVVWRRAPFSSSVCNAMARLAGLGAEGVCNG